MMNKHEKMQDGILTEGMRRIERNGRSYERVREEMIGLGYCVMLRDWSEYMDDLLPGDYFQHKTSGVSISIVWYKGINKYCGLKEDCGEYMALSEDMPVPYEVKELLNRHGFYDCNYEDEVKSREEAKSIEYFASARQLEALGKGLLDEVS